jgi:hypothetical protein
VGSDDGGSSTGGGAIDTTDFFVFVEFHFDHAMIMYLNVIDDKCHRGAIIVLFAPVKT